MQYLANKHGLDRFYPTDPGERAMVDSAMFYLVGTLYPLVTRATYPTLGFPQYAGEYLEADEAMKAKAQQDAVEALAGPLEVYRAFFLDGPDVHRRRPPLDRRHPVRRDARSSCARSTTSSRGGWRTTWPPSSRRSARRTPSRQPTFAASSTTSSRRPRDVIRVCIAGVTGWTGRAVADAVGAADDMELVGVAFDPARFPSVAGALDAVETDVLVDYTHADVVRENVLAALAHGVHVVVGSSGADRRGLRGDRRARPGACGRRDRGRQLLRDRGPPPAPGDRGGAPPRRMGGGRLRERREAGRPERHAREPAERLESVRRPRLGVPLDQVVGAPGPRRDGRRDAGALAAAAELRRLDRDRVRSRERTTVLRHDAGETPAPYGGDASPSAACGNGSA